MGSTLCCQGWICLHVRIPNQNNIPEGQIGCLFDQSICLLKQNCISTQLIHKWEYYKVAYSSCRKLLYNIPICGSIELKYNFVLIGRLTGRIGTQFDPLGCYSGLVSLHEGRSSPGNRELSLSHLGAVLSLLQLLLGLPVLGQVQSCNLLSLLDLLLVGLDLLLELLGEVGHLVLVLLIILLLELQFLNPPLRLLVSLGEL